MLELLSIALTDLLFKRILVIGSQQRDPKYLYKAFDFVTTIHASPVLLH